MHDTTLPPGSTLGDLSFQVTEVTGVKMLQVDGVDGHRLAGEVASAMAGILDLPENSRYYLRDDHTARMLVDDDPLGVQIPATGARLMVVPKTKLG